MRPQTKEERFNLRHASLRNVIERCFSVLKRQFKIFQKAPEYSYKTQMTLIYTLCALNNFIHYHSKGRDEIEIEIAQKERLRQNASVTDSNQENRDTDIEVEDQAMSSLREQIASQMWIDYSNYIARTQK